MAEDEARNDRRYRNPRCEVNARKGTGTGVCDAPLGPFGECPNAGKHIVEDRGAE